MAKTMCKIAKELPESIDKIIQIASNPSFVCKKCGRVANIEDRLCKPMKMED